MHNEHATRHAQNQPGTTRPPAHEDPFRASLRQLHAQAAAHPPKPAPETASLTVEQLDQQIQAGFEWMALYALIRASTLGDQGPAALAEDTAYIRELRAEAALP